jgi:hypothetical protein
LPILLLPIFGISKSIIIDWFDVSFENALFPIVFNMMGTSGIISNKFVPSSFVI